MMSPERKAFSEIGRDARRSRSEVDITWEERWTEAGGEGDNG
jgi:hypothetical protein